MFNAFKGLFKEQTAGNASATATEDQASAHGKEPKLERTAFELDVQEGAPTSDQLTSILEYLGQDKIGSVVQGASSVSDALSKFRKDENVFQRPVVVDWGNGRAVVGDSESEILKLVKSLPHESK
ncbi:hypothetical protein MBLNU459_g5656t2 [Dothideomycetes sp. NU459]